MQLRLRASCLRHLIKLPLAGDDSLGMSERVRE